MGGLIQSKKRIMMNAVRELRITYGEGLNRVYNRYDNNDARCRTTDDIFIKAGQTMTIVATGYDAAVSAWENDAKNNILYGGWNKNLDYTPQVDSLCKIVFKRKDNSNFVADETKGKISVTVGNITYKH